MNARRVLLVDDDEAIREFVSLFLTDEGYEVATAADGAAALELVTQARPDVILLDLSMPVMDGWEFSEAYRRLPGPHAPVVALTAANDVLKSVQAIDTAGTLAKPFGLDDLLKLLTDVLARSGPNGWAARRAAGT